MHKGQGSNKMVHHLLLHSSLRSTSNSLLKPPLPLLNTPSSLLRQVIIKSYSKIKEEDHHEIGVKARSTAEEFARVAREKADELESRNSEKFLEGAQEAVLSDSDSESVKHKCKETMKGTHKKIMAKD